MYRKAKTELTETVEKTQELKDKISNEVESKVGNYMQQQAEMQKAT